jgi:hypothetical protein
VGESSVCKGQQAAGCCEVEVHDTKDRSRPESLDSMFEFL